MKSKLLNKHVWIIEEEYNGYRWPIYNDDDAIFNTRREARQRLKELNERWRDESCCFYIAKYKRQ